MALVEPDLARPLGTRNHPFSWSPSNGVASYGSSSLPATSSSRLIVLTRTAARCSFSSSSSSYALLALLRQQRHDSCEIDLGLPLPHRPDHFRAVLGEVLMEQRHSKLIELAARTRSRITTSPMRSTLPDVPSARASLSASRVRTSPTACLTRPRSRRTAAPRSPTPNWGMKYGAIIQKDSGPPVRLANYSMAG